MNNRMIITVNGETIDFTLENEKTAGEVVNGLTSWLESSGLLISNLKLNSEIVSLVDTDWQDTDVFAVNQLDVEAVNVRVGRIRQLETARDYFALLDKAAESDDMEALTELSESFEDLKHLLPRLLGETAENGIAAGSFERLAAAGFPVQGKGLLLDTTATVAEAARMAYILDSRRRETETPHQEAAAAASALAVLAPSLQDVAVHLQTGKDREAMNTIIRLTELLQSLMRSLSWSEAGYGESIAADMKNILEELEEALRVQDTVLIGDLLEYEIQPRLEELPVKLEHEGNASQ